MQKSGKVLIALLLPQVLILLLLFALSFKKENLLISFGDAEATDNEESAISLFEENEVLLTPGVYKVEVYFKDEVPNDSGVQIVAKDDIYHSLLSNMVPVFPQDKYIEFNVWAAKKCMVRPKVISGKENYNPILYMNIIKTSKGFFVIASILFGVFFVIDALIVLRIKILNNELSKKKQIVFAAMLSAIILAFFPLLSGYCYLGSEGRFIFFPVFLLHAGLPFYAVYKIYVFVLLLFSALTSYYCMRFCFKDEVFAMILSVVYLLFPYHLYSIYDKGAMEEGLLYIFLPFVFMIVYLLIEKLFIKKKLSIKDIWVNSSKYLKALLIGALLLYVLIAIYKVNSFAFEHRAVYLYDAVNSFKVYAFFEK